MSRFSLPGVAALWRLSALAALVADPGAALACTCSPVSLGDRIREAPAIFAGRVVAVGHPAPGSPGGGLGVSAGDRLVGSASSA